MLFYYLKCRKNTDSKNLIILRTKKGRLIPLWNCIVCYGKTSKFMKEDDLIGLLSNLGIKKFLSQIPLVCPLLY